MSDRAPLLRIEDAEAAALIVAAFNSFVVDFASRSAVGGTDLSYFIIKQLPILQPREFLNENRAGYTYAEFIVPRVLELTYTSWDLQPFAEDLGYDGPPFPWDEERRFFLQCEIDAALFHLYGIERDDVDYVMETFPIVKRDDERRYQEYRTKRVILDMYDEMAYAKQVGTAYFTRLNPPPPRPRRLEPDGCVRRVP